MLWCSHFWAFDIDRSNVTCIGKVLKLCNFIPQSCDPGLQRFRNIFDVVIVFSKVFFLVILPAIKVHSRPTSSIPIWMLVQIGLTVSWLNYFLYLHWNSKGSKWMLINVDPLFWEILRSRLLLLCGNDNETMPLVGECQQYLQGKNRCDLSKY